MPHQNNLPAFPAPEHNGHQTNVPGEPDSSLSPPSQRSSEVHWAYATQELLDSLPRSWTRGLLYFLLIFATIALPWACLSRVDETGKARGRLEPQGRTMRLDTAVSGTVTHIQAKEGQTVQAGQVLLELNSETIRNDLQQAQSKLESQTDRLSQLQLIKTQLEISNRTQEQQNQAKIAAQLAEINQIQRQQQFNQDASGLAVALLAKDQETVKRFQSLRKEGIISGIQLDEAERRLIDNTERLKRSQSDVEQSQEELSKQQSQYESTLKAGELAVLEGRKQLEELQSQITALRSEITQVQNQIKSLQFQLQQHTIRAPVAGTIFELPIQQAGAVVQPGMMVAQIAPQDTSLILRVQMTSQDSGFLHPGMPVKAKFDAYPFQDYGVVEGKLSWISPNSKIQDSPQGKVETFELEVTLNQSYIQTPTRKIILKPGQAATAEVVIRQRRVIDFVLDPFRKLQKGGLDL